MIKKPAKLIEFVPVGQTSGHEIRARSVTLKDGALSIQMCAKEYVKRMRKIAFNGECGVLLWKNKTSKNLGMFLISVNSGVITGVKL